MLRAHPLPHTKLHAKILLKEGYEVAWKTFKENYFTYYKLIEI
jgi:hypothetical protein